jgi:hypothetical protein
MMREKWKEIPGFNAMYEVSTAGRVRSWKRPGAWDMSITPTMMKGTVERCGYSRIKLRNNEIIKRFFRHRLVAEAFIPNPKNKPEINHIDGNKLNNHVVNLEWCTCKENAIHAYETGLSPRGSEKPNAKLTEGDVKKIKYLILNTDKMQEEIAEIFGVCQTAISRIKLGKTWKHV